MSTEVNAQNGATVSEIDALLDKYLKGGDPTSTPTAAPLNIRFGNDQISVKTPEELQGEVDRRLSGIAQAYRQEKAQYEARLAAIQAAQAAQNQPAPPPSTETRGGNDPMEFVQNLVSDPNGTLEKALADKFARIDQLEKALETQRFTMSHPLYASDPKIMQGLEQVCIQSKMPVTAQNMEMAAAWAVKNNLLPDENVFREQQRAQLMAALQAAQNGQQPQPQTQPGNFNNYVKSPYGQYMQTPPPPPSTSGVQNATVSPSQIEMAERLAPKMSPEDLKSFILNAGGNV